jgi:hypothetical protein
MSKDALSAGADQSGAGMAGGTARARDSKIAIGYGGVAGFAVGVLNLVAVGHGWALKDYFDVLDSPFVSLFDPTSGYYVQGGFSASAYEPGALPAILIYWTVIGWFLGWLYLPSGPVIVPRSTTSSALGFQFWP